MLSLVLAGGKGTRMKSSIHKTLHTVNGKPIIEKMRSLLENTGISKQIFILGHKKDDVLEYLGEDIEYVIQEQQLGTGHAIIISKEKLEKYKEDIFIVNGDAPLLRESTLKSMKDKFYKENLDCVFLTCEMKEPLNYGRIIRENQEQNGKIINLVEEKDATEEEKKVKEINVGAYIFKYDKLINALDRIDNNNAQGEYYLPDLVKVLINDGDKVEAFKICNEDEVMGVNSKEELAIVSKILRKRKNNQLMSEGVILIDPDNTYIEEDVEIGQDTIIYPNVIIEGKTKIGANCTIIGNSRIENSIISDNVKIESSVIEKSMIDSNVTVGPFAHLRPNAYLKETSHVGNFVEIKNAVIDEGVKVGHLSYIGDAQVGEKTNIGAGTITCNYDGKKKHKTIIGKNSFIGSNTILVAPVEVGENSFTAAGSTITKNVKNNTLAFGRAKQINKEGWQK